MKLAMLQLLVLTKACVMLAVMVNCMNASRPQVYCILTESSTRANFTNCTAFYYEDVVMVCPESDSATTNVLWYKDGVQGPVSENSTVSLPLHQCTESQAGCVYKSLSYNDDGMYYCKHEVNGARYYVNLTVSAPPKILGQLDHCEFPDYNICYQPEVMADRIKTTVKLSVEYYGSGNLSVTWSHNNHSLFHKKHGDCNYNIATNSNGMWHRSVLTLDTNPLCSVEGVYTANVSNEIGWNMSSINVDYECHPFYPPPPGKLPELHSHLLRAGTRDVPFTCHANFGEDYMLSTNLVMCYAPHNKSIASLNFDTDCITCQLYSSSHAQCGKSIAMRDTWSVSLTKEQLKKSLSSMCGIRYTTTLTIPIVTENDGGMLYCLWQTRGSSSLNESYIYENHTIDIVPSDRWYPQYIVPALGALTVLLPVVTCIGAVLYYNKKMRTLKKNSTVTTRTTPSRSIHRKPSKKSSTCQPVLYGATDIPSSDDDCLFRPISTTRQSTSTNYSPTDAVNVEVHPTVNARTPLLANCQAPVLKPTEEPMAGWITEGPPLCYTDPEWDLAGAQKVDSQEV